MKSTAKYRLGDIIEFWDDKQKLVDRINCIHISSKTGCEYWLEHYDGGYVTDDLIVRVVERVSDIVVTTWPSKYKSGQMVDYLYSRHIENSEIEEVSWRVTVKEKAIQYYMKNGAGPVYEKDVLCQKSVIPTTKPPELKSGKPSLKLLKNEAKSTEPGKK